jgi:hypothetical protein
VMSLPLVDLNNSMGRLIGPVCDQARSLLKRSR